MRSLTSRQSQSGPLVRTGRLRFLVAALLLVAAQPASAATWGHLRGPFSAESEQLERANFAAEERSAQRSTAELPSIGHRATPCRIWRRL
jgi:hypothetical protein